MGIISNGVMAAVIKYLEGAGYLNVTLVDEGGNVVLATSTPHQLVAFVVDEYDGEDEQWEEDAYRESINDLAEGGMRFDRGDVITVTHLDGDGDTTRSQLEHRTGVWPGGE